MVQTANRASCFLFQIDDILKPHYAILKLFQFKDFSLWSQIVKLAEFQRVVFQVSTNSKKKIIFKSFGPFFPAFLRISKLQYSFSLEYNEQGNFFLAKVASVLLSRKKKEFSFEKNSNWVKTFFFTSPSYEIESCFQLLIYKLLPSSYSNASLILYGSH